VELMGEFWSGQDSKTRGNLLLLFFIILNRCQKFGQTEKRSLCVQTDGWVQTIVIILLPMSTSS